MIKFIWRYSIQSRTAVWSEKALLLRYCDNDEPITSARFFFQYACTIWRFLTAKLTLLIGSLWLCFFLNIHISSAWVSIHDYYCRWDNEKLLPLRFSESRCYYICGNFCLLSSQRNCFDVHNRWITTSHAYNVMPVVGVELSLQSTLVFSVLVKQDFKRIMRPGSSYDTVPMTKLMQLRSLIHQNISPNW